MNFSHFKTSIIPGLALLVAGLFSFNTHAAADLTPALTKYCSKMNTQFKKYGWDKSACESFDWIHIRNSVQGDPLPWTVFGDATDEEKPSFKQKDVTIIMCGVHGDEITPVKLCFDIMAYLKEQYSNPETVKKDFPNKIVIVAPLVNPDSFFKVRPSRINAHGVDINRNFPTKDWQRDARRLWISQLRKDKRRNPGMSASSEPEVVFQMNLIKRYGPDKIISVHSPLTLLDYDGPNTTITGFVDGNKAQELLNKMSKDASDYKIEDYPFFPGSLGNWAGKERDIPTYTLELPTSNPAKSSDYWKLFKSAIHNAITHDLKEKTTQSPDQSPAPAPTTDASKDADTKSAEVAVSKKDVVN
jgi:protein MpaA